MFIHLYIWILDFVIASAMLYQSMLIPFIYLVFSLYTKLHCTIRFSSLKSVTASGVMN